MRRKIEKRKETERSEREIKEKNTRRMGEAKEMKKDKHENKRKGRGL